MKSNLNYSRSLVVSPPLRDGGLGQNVEQVDIFEAGDFNQKREGALITGGRFTTNNLE